MPRGHGCFLEDVDGHRYIDFCGEYTAGLFGHSEPRIQAALHAAIDRGLNLASVGEREGQLAALLCARFPSLERVRFTNSGTEANMMALGAARAFSGRPGVLAFRGGYHGGLIDAWSAAAARSIHRYRLAGRLQRYPTNVEVLRAHAGEIAAVILEPMMGSGGCIPARPEFLAALRAGQPRAGVLLLFDEVMTSRHSVGWPPEAARRNTGPHNAWQVHGRRHELRRLRRSRRRNGPF